MKIKIPEIKVKVTFTEGEKIILARPEDTINLLRQIFDADRFHWCEEMILICLNRQNQVIGFNKIASGGISGVVCDPKVILTIALQSAASNIILSHNHPSGNNKPSNADIEISQKIKKAAELLDINLLDHIILTRDGSTSLSECGYL